MRLSTLEVDGREQPAVLVPERGLALFAEIDASLPDSLLAALSEGLPEGLADAAASLPDERLIRLADAVYRPLYRRPRKILGIGLNYRAHAADLSASEPTEPASFLKAEHTIIGYGDVIELPPQSKRVTAEAELGLIFGRECRGVDQGEALQCIAGVCLILDQTAEDILQVNPRFLTRAKNFPGFFSFGPELITMDEVYGLFPTLSEIRISTVRNHKVEASATVADMIFSPSYLVSFHSRVMPFYPGDVLSTGTPGAAVISDGDVVECAIDGLGTLRNSVGGGATESRPGE
jgi:2-keto-4-pentenoate hydratase/2-oxohepta-3-ene-1,7-dioic acid hydratase in catechol pathway